MQYSNCWIFPNIHTLVTELFAFINFAFLITGNAIDCYIYKVLQKHFSTTMLDCATWCCLAWVYSGIAFLLIYCNTHTIMCLIHVCVFANVETEFVHLFLVIVLTSPLFIHIPIVSIIKCSLYNRIFVTKINKNLEFCNKNCLH